MAPGLRGQMTNEIENGGLGRHPPITVGSASDFVGHMHHTMMSQSLFWERLLA
jgi:hypothetical protein